MKESSIVLFDMCIYLGFEGIYSVLRVYKDLDQLIVVYTLEILILWLCLITEENLIELTGSIVVD